MKRQTASAQAPSSRSAETGAAIASTAPMAVATALPPWIPMGRPFQEKTGVGRTTQAELIRKRELRTVLVCAAGHLRGRRLIETQSWLEYVARQRQREAAGEIGMASPNPRARRHR